MAIFQFKIYRIRLKKRKNNNKRFLKLYLTHIQNHEVTKSQLSINRRTDRLGVLQNETLILCALESQGDGEIIGQTKVWEVV